MRKFDSHFTLKLLVDGEINDSESTLSQNTLDAKSTDVSWNHFGFFQVRFVRVQAFDAFDKSFLFFLHVMSGIWMEMLLFDLR